MTIKVLIVEDSKFFAKNLAKKIDGVAGIEVVAVLNNGQEAVEQVEKYKPDVITMDVQMPIKDGITAVQEIMAKLPARILMLSALTESGAKETIDALKAGALDFLPKSPELFEEDKIIDIITQIARISPPTVLEARKYQTLQKKQHVQQLELILLGASTGGPVAVERIIEELPENFPIPMMVILHMPEYFTKSYAEIVNQNSKLEVVEAKNNDELLPNHVYIAPGGRQISFVKKQEKTYIIVADNVQKLDYSPCIDFTLLSAAEIFESQVLAMILTGMGNDGLKGCEKIKELGGNVWAQDKESSVVYGMPNAVTKAGLVDKVFSINQLSKLLVEEYT